MAYNQKTKNWLILPAIVFIFFILPLSPSHLQNNTATAQTGNEGKTYTLLEPLPCIPYTYKDAAGKEITKSCGTEPIKQMDLGNFFIYAFNLLIALAAVSAVFMMVYGGFLYTSTAPMQKNEGKDKFLNAIWGLLMVLGAFLILRTVNPKLVEIPSSIPAINVPASQQQSPLAMFDSLSQVAANVPEARSSLAETRQNITNAQSRLSALEQRRDAISDSSDPEARSLDVQIAQLESQIAESKNDEWVNQESIVIRQYINYCSGSTNPQNCIDSMNSTYRNYYEKYTAENPERTNDNMRTLDRLQEQVEWGEASVKIGAEVAKVGDSSNAQESFVAIANIKRIRDEYGILLINNPELKNNVSATAQAAIDRINATPTN